MSENQVSILAGLFLCAGLGYIHGLAWENQKWTGRVFAVILTLFAVWAVGEAFKNLLGA